MATYHGDREPITVTIITSNEEHHLPSAIRSVSWAEEILVVDSGSKDKTVEIARSLGARVVENPWQGYGQQKNFAQKQATHDWVLNIDADEVVSPELAAEIRDTLRKIKEKKIHIEGFSLPRKTFYLGRWIQHGGWYPNYLTRMANRKSASWTEPHVHEKLIVSGRTLRLRHPLLHHAFSKIEDQVLTNLRFSRLGSEDLKKRGIRPHLSKLLLKPIGKFVETYFLKRGFLDGLPGLIISLNAAHSIFLKFAYLHEDTIRRKVSK